MKKIQVITSSTNQQMN